MLASLSLVFALATPVDMAPFDMLIGSWRGASSGIIGTGVTHRTYEHVYDGKVVFLTVLTSDGKPGNRANRSTAQRWAKQFRLDPDRVIAGDEWTRVIPTHIVFSPLGQTLYFKTGLHSEAQIRSTLGKAIREWEPWYAENKNSMSVLLSEIGD